MKDILSIILVCLLISIAWQTIYIVKIEELKDLRQLDNKAIEDLQNRLKKANLDYSIG